MKGLLTRFTKTDRISIGEGVYAVFSPYAGLPYDLELAAAEERAEKAGVTAQGAILTLKVGEAFTRTMFKHVEDEKGVIDKDVTPDVFEKFLKSQHGDQAIAMIFKWFELRAKGFAKEALELANEEAKNSGGG